MLGTNDSAITGPNGAPASPGKYHENMKTIIDKLLALYPKCKVVLHRPVWYSPNTYNGAKYLEEGLNRLQSYYPELQALVLHYSKHFRDRSLWEIRMVSIISRRIIKKNSFPKKVMPALSICTRTGKGRQLWERCGGKRYLVRLWSDN